MVHWPNVHPLFHKDLQDLVNTHIMMMNDFVVRYAELAARQPPAPTPARGITPPSGHKAAPAPETRPLSPGPTAIQKARPLASLIRPSPSPDEMQKARPLSPSPDETQKAPLSPSPDRMQKTPPLSPSPLEQTARPPSPTPVRAQRKGPSQLPWPEHKHKQEAEHRPQEIPEVEQEAKPKRSKLASPGVELTMAARQAEPLPQERPEAKKEVQIRRTKGGRLASPGTGPSLELVTAARQCPAPRTPTPQQRRSSPPREFRRDADHAPGTPTPQQRRSSPPREFRRDDADHHGQESGWETHADFEEEQAEQDELPPAKRAQPPHADFEEDDEDDEEELPPAKRAQPPMQPPPLRLVLAPPPMDPEFEGTEEEWINRFRGMM